MHRFFVNEIAGDTAAITGDDVHHLLRVLRMKKGDALVLCDGQGTDYDAVIDALQGDRVVCCIGAGRASGTEPDCRLTLFQALPKGGKLETIVQKCTEIGVYDVRVFTCARCDAQIGGDFEKKLARLRRVALEAAKQSRRGRVPRVTGPLDIDGIRPAEFDLLLLAYEAERAHSLKAALRAAPAAKRIAMVIGPEGGFAAEEAALLAGRGAVPVSLGPRILRTETAGAAMCAQILYEVEA